MCPFAFLEKKWKTVKERKSSVMRQADRTTLVFSNLNCALADFSFQNTNFMRINGMSARSTSNYSWVDESSQHSSPFSPCGNEWRHKGNPWTIRGKWSIATGNTVRPEVIAARAKRANLLTIETEFWEIVIQCDSRLYYNKILQCDCK